MKAKIVSVYSVIHFIVDLSCAVLVSNYLTSKLGAENVFLAILIYNFFAFAVQLPVGIIADRLNKNALVSCVGCLLVAGAYALTFNGVLCCIVAGLGNAMFHIGGGIDVLNISERMASFPGLFVSTGALGIFLGAKSLSWGFTLYYLPVILLVISAVILALLYNSIKDKVSNSELRKTVLTGDTVVAVICIFVTVYIRSYVGMIMAFEWKANFALAFAAIFAVILGKMLGGIIGDKTGFTLVSITLVISAVLFIFSFDCAACGIIAILLFNMTMPITLTVLANIFETKKGFAFGLLTLALFVGAVPKFLGFYEKAFTPAGLCILTLISALALFIAVKKYEITEAVKND